MLKCTLSISLLIQYKLYSSLRALRGVGLQGAVGRSHESWHRTCTHTSFSQRDCLERRTNIASDIFHVCLDVTLSGAERQQRDSNPLFWQMTTGWRYLDSLATPAGCFSAKDERNLTLIWFPSNICFICVSPHMSSVNHGYHLQFIPRGRLKQETTPGRAWLLTNSGTLY